MEYTPNAADYVAHHIQSMNAAQYLLFIAAMDKLEELGVDHLRIDPVEYARRAKEGYRPGLVVDGDDGAIVIRRRD